MSRTPARYAPTSSSQTRWAIFGAARTENLLSRCSWMTPRLNRYLVSRNSSRIITCLRSRGLTRRRELPPAMSPWVRSNDFAYVCGGGGSAVGCEEVVDEGCAVVARDGAQAGHACECEGSDELANCEVAVDVAEFGVGFRAGEDGVERLAVLVDDAGPQCPGCVTVVGLFFGAGGAE